MLTFLFLDRLVREPLAYLNGALIPASQAVLPVYDTGFVQGATVTEQLRTFGGELFRVPEHLRDCTLRYGQRGLSRGNRWRILRTLRAVGGEQSRAD